MWPTAPSRGFGLHANEESRVAAKEVSAGSSHFYRPWRGLGRFAWLSLPRLSPWATLYRPPSGLAESRTLNLAPMPPRPPPEDRGKRGRDVG
jgi:hypothetical protein